MNYLIIRDVSIESRFKVTIIVKGFAVQRLAWILRQGKLWWSLERIDFVVESLNPMTLNFASRIARSLFVFVVSSIFVPSFIAPVLTTRIWGSLHINRKRESKRIEVSNSFNRLIESNILLILNFRAQIYDKYLRQNSFIFIEYFSIIFNF